MSKVKVYTEWGRLKEVVVGNCLNFSVNLNDSTFQMVYYDSLKSQEFQSTDMYTHDIKRLKDRTEDLDNLAKVLESHGVHVYRPSALTEATHIKTPNWGGITTAPDQPRDTFMCVGDTIIETPPTVRGRYFESTHYHELFHNYFRSGARWINAPRPKLTEESIDWYGLEHWAETDKFHTLDEIPRVFDIAFDAANCLKLGRDILFNVGNMNAELGVVWLKKMLPDFNVIPVRITDDHLDGAIMPLRPGTFLYNPKHNEIRDIRSRLPHPYNTWEMIPTEDEDLGSDYTEDEIRIASEQCMALNVLSIDEKKLLIPDDAVNTIASLRRHGFEPIPIPFRHSRLFSGGIHCATTDIRRDDAHYYQ